MGRGIVQTLAARRIKVFAADLDPDSAQQSIESVIAAEATGKAFRVDVSESDSVRNLFEDVRALTDRLDMLVHCAAIMAGPQTLKIFPIPSGAQLCP